MGGNPDGISFHIQIMSGCDFSRKRRISTQITLFSNPTYKTQHCMSALLPPPQLPPPPMYRLNIASAFVLSGCVSCCPFPTDPKWTSQNIPWKIGAVVTRGVVWDIVGCHLFTHPCAVGRPSTCRPPPWQRPPSQSTRPESMRASIVAIFFRAIVFYLFFCGNLIKPWPSVNKDEMWKVENSGKLENSCARICFYQFVQYIVCSSAASSSGL